LNSNATHIEKGCTRIRSTTTVAMERPQHNGRKKCEE
jgi:hypothetical protein